MNLVVPFQPGLLCAWQSANSRDLREASVRVHRMASYASFRRRLFPFPTYVCTSHDVPPPFPVLFLFCFLPLARPGYFEVDIDVGSSTLASNATHLAGGYAKNLVLDLAFALQVRCFRIRVNV